MTPPDARQVAEQICAIRVSCSEGQCPDCDAARLANTQSLVAAALSEARRQVLDAASPWMQHLPRCFAIPHFPIAPGKCSCGLDNFMRAIPSEQTEAPRP